MAIKGSLKEASLPDVFQLLAMGGKTGCLTVTDRSNFGYIYFDGGRIIYASLLNRRDRLGDILAKDGVITREQLDEAIEQQAESRDDRRLGEILKDEGVIDEQTLERYVRLQIEEAVYHLFTWSQGTFYFEPGQRPEKEPILVSINHESLLLEGARRVDEWGQIEKKIPSLDLIFAVDDDRLPATEDLDLTDEQRRILPYIDGEHSVWDLMEETALAEFDVGKALYGLISAGFVRRAGVQEGDGRRAETRARVDEHRNLGVAFYKTAMYDEAVREFRRVLELDPKSLDVVFYLGLVAIREGDPAEAAQQFREVLERGGERAGVYNNLALALDRLGKTREAIDILERGLDLGLRHPRLFLSKAVLEMRSRDPSAARSTLEAYREQVTGELEPLYYSTAALASALLGDLDEAARMVDAGVARHPLSVALVNNAGVIFERKGDRERAATLYDQAFDEDPTLPQVSKNIGDLLYKNGAYDEAAEAYERVLRLNPDLGDDVYAKLGNVHYKRRDRDKAIELWRRALELDPENDVVRTNLELVTEAIDE